MGEGAYRPPKKKLIFWKYKEMVQFFDADYKINPGLVTAV